jgi:hypothetical protein
MPPLSLHAHASCCAFLLRLRDVTQASNVFDFFAPFPSKQYWSVLGSFKIELI